MFNFASVSFVLCILQLLAIAECKPDVPAKQKQVIFTKVEQEMNPDYLTLSVNLVNHTDRNPTVNLNAELFQDIPDNLYINNIISRRASQMEYHALIKTGRINLCDFFKNPDREPFLKILLANLEKYGRMMFNCPVKKGHYYLKDFQMDSGTLPSFTPNGDYKVDFAISRKEKDAFVQIYRMMWYATVYFA